MHSLSIIHATSRFVVVNKPAGLLSVPGRPIPGGPDHQDCVPARVRAMFPRARGPLTVHRLDMETSGLIVLGLDEAAQRDLSMQFEQRRVAKSYTALIATPPPSDSGRITLPIRLDLEHRPRQIVDFQLGRPSITDWSVIDRSLSTTRLGLVPLTGRSHQLRLHLADPRGLGSPILGDTLYGGRPAPRLMLHAHQLAFDDPETGRRVAFDCPAPF